jgi:DNA-directed RNA polymerase specialized sigma24 family protein
VLETTSLVHESYLRFVRVGELQIDDRRRSSLVEMRYSGGYSDREIAETLGLTERTVQRDWEKARLILTEALR